MAGIGAAAHRAGAVRQQLPDRDPRDIAMQSSNIRADRVVEPHAAGFAELQHAGRREGLRMRRDPETVLRRQRHAACQVGMAEGEIEDDLEMAGDRQRATRLLRESHLVLDPARDLVDGSGARFLQGSPPKPQPMQVRFLPVRLAS